MAHLSWQMMSWSVDDTAYPAELSLGRSSLDAQGLCVLKDVSAGDTIPLADTKNILILNCCGGERWSRLQPNAEEMR